MTLKGEIMRRRLAAVGAGLGGSRRTPDVGECGELMVLRVAGTTAEVPLDDMPLGAVAGEWWGWPRGG